MVTGTIVIDRDHVVCLTSDVRRDGAHPFIAETTAPFHGFEKGITLENSGIYEAVDSTISRACVGTQHRIRNFYVGVPGRFCEILPKASQPPHGQSSLAHMVLDDGSEMELFAQNTYLQVMKRAIIEAGGENCHFISQNYAEGMLIIPKFERDNIAIMVNLGYYDTNICVYSGEAQIYQRTINIGDSFIAKDLSLVLEIDREYAEQLKRQYIFGITYEKDAIDYVRMADRRLWGFEHALVDEVIRARMDEMIGFIARELFQIKEQLHRGAKAYFLGPGMSDMRGVKEYIAGKLGIQFGNLPLFLLDGSSRYSATAIAVTEAALAMQETPVRQSKLAGIANFFRKR